MGVVFMTDCRVCKKFVPPEDYVVTHGGAVCHDCTERMADAFDVQMERAWGVQFYPKEGWTVWDENRSLIRRGSDGATIIAADPITAILEANEFANRLDAKEPTE